MSWAHAELVEQLRTDASRLRDDVPAPVDLEALVVRLGLKLRAVQRPEGSSVEATLVPGGEQSEIVLWREKEKRPWDRHRERFSIAHELGHYCAMRRFNVRPRSEREYWMLERACDDFAGRLLVSDADIEAGVRRTITSPRDLLPAIRRVQQACEVSLAVAARRLPDAIEGTSICFLALPSRTTETCVAIVEWAAGRTEWLGFEARASIPRNDVAAGVVEAVAQEHQGTTKVIDFGTTKIAAERATTGIWVAALSVLHERANADPVAALF